MTVIVIGLVAIEAARLTVAIGRRGQSWLQTRREHRRLAAAHQHLIEQIERAQAEHIGMNAKLGLLQVAGLGDGIIDDEYI